MPHLTDPAIRAALRAGRPATLSDGGGRGQGRLQLAVRILGDRPLAEWYAVAWRDGRRATAKLGRYPELSLAEARARFAADYAGRDVRRAERPAGTVRELFEGYVASLAARGATSAEDVGAKLAHAAEAIGPDRLAAEVSTEDLLEVLRPIYQRGAPSMADHVRSYLRSAFAWAMKAERDYRVAVDRRFRIAANPAEQIPTEPKVAGDRWLSPEEFATLWRWLEAPPAGFPAPYARCLQLMMATGQRVRMLTQLRAEQWDPVQRLLSWERTKNGRPHVLPLTPFIARLLPAAEPGALFFPSVRWPDEPPTDNHLYCALWRAELPIAAFSPRDLRRTWKTLAGQAGVSKEVRDALQCHARHDVSSRHYDRYDGLREKREGMAAWSAWLEGLLGGGRVLPMRPRARRREA